MTSFCSDWFASLAWWLHSHFHHQFPVSAGGHLGASHEPGVFQVPAELPCGAGGRDSEWRRSVTSSPTRKFCDMSIPCRILASHIKSTSVGFTLGLAVLVFSGVRIFVLKSWS